MSSKREPIKYKDTLAMPGSELWELLTAGKKKEAEASYQATELRLQRALKMGTEPKKEQP